jgi:type IV pilus assembly protein PilC
MPLYEVKVLDQSKNGFEMLKLQGTTATAVKEQLVAQGKIVVEIDAIQEFNFRNFIGSLPGLDIIFAPRIPSKEKVIIVQQLAVLLQAGITLVEGLYLLEQQSTSEHTQKVLRQVRSDVVGGDAFSFALSRHRDFDNFFIKTIKAGEISGNMDTIAARLAVLLEKMNHLQGKLMAAMMYPGFTVLVVVLVIVVIMIVVVPNFEKVFQQSKTDLPEPTKILIAMSRFTCSFWWLLLGLTAGAIAWILNFYNGVGRPIIDGLVLRIPLVGLLITKIHVSRFIRTLATLLASGVPMIEAVSSSVDTIDNRLIHDSLAEVKTTLMSGTSSLSKLLEKTGLIPKMVYKMIAVGEETGEMDRMLNKAGDILDREVDEVLETVSKLIEPLMIVIVGGIVLFVMMALYLPMFDLSKTQ